MRLFVFAFLLAFASPAAAQEPGSLKELITELNALLDKGEKERLADPWYLKDLRDLTAKYDNPWQGVVYLEEFQTDGAPPAPWQVLEGEMRVDWRSGLRSLVRASQTTSLPEPDPAPTQEPHTTQALTGKDAAKQIFGAVLGGLLKGSGGEQPTPAPEPEAPPEPTAAEQFEALQALAIAPTAIPNSFRLKGEFSAQPLRDGTTANVEIGVYQQAGSGRPGYGLTFDAAAGSLSLIRISSRGGRGLIESVAAPEALQDGAPHALDWARYPDGRMTVTIDGAELLSTLDRSFRDPWDGLALTNKGGDFSLRRIEVMGGR